MSLLFDKHPLVVNPTLATIIGLNEAIVLQQIHYWTDDRGHRRDGRTWVYNSVSEWAKQFPFWSQATVKRTLASLEKQGLVVVGNYNADRRDRTKWFAIDHDRIEALRVAAEEEAGSERCIGSNCTNAPAQNDPLPLGQNDPTITRDYPETTSETNGPSPSGDGSPPAKRTAKPERKHPLPDDFAPNDTCWQKAETLGVPLEIELEKFRDFHLAKGNKYVDWQAAFRNWLTKAAEFRAKRPAGSPGRTTPGDTWEPVDDIGLTAPASTTVRRSPPDDNSWPDQHGIMSLPDGTRCHVDDWNAGEVRWDRKQHCAVWRDAS